MQQDDPTDLPIGDIQFYDNVKPGIKDDDYTITATPALSGVVGASLAPKTQNFSVQGARFTLDPTNDVQFLYPPDKSCFQFEQKLPHIVLNKRSLPWERNLNLQPLNPQIPWIALLVFDEEEITPPPPPQGNPSQNISPTKSTLLPLSQVRNINSGGILGPAIATLNYGQTDTMMCQTIDISTQTFIDIVPLSGELPYLTHVREVNVGNKVIMNMTHSGWFSVVISNRFPVKNPSIPTKQICHLVSLEGFENYLVANPSFPSGVNTVRLISLVSWSFTCLPESNETFSALANNLVTSSSEAGTNLLFKMPQGSLPPQPTAEQTAAYKAIDTGFIPMSYKTRSSDQTFAWYRGPFSPVISERFTMDESTTIAPFESSGEAVIYDQNYGLFNLSYAVAFETGRMLALADKTFSDTLLKWRREANYFVDLFVTRLNNYNLLSLLNTESSDINTWLQSQLVSDTYLSYILGDFSEKIAPRIPSIYNPVQTNPTPPANPQPSPVFSPPTTPPDLAAEIKTFLQQSDAVSLLQQMGTTQLTIIIEWLARLYLLYGVPTNTLIPCNQDLPSDSSILYHQLLPPESIRFFYLDRAWLDSLIDGAMSIGVHTSKDSPYYTLTKNIIMEGIETLILELRQQELGLPISPSNTLPDNMSGFLLRSQLVQNWPSLEVLAYSSISANQPDIKALRMDRLSPTVLLCLYPGIPAKIILREPSEGICFGVELGNTENQELIYLRNISDGTVQGSPYQIQSTDYRTNTDNRVFNIAQLQQNLSKTLGTTQFSPADFALQMIDVPEQMVFQNAATT